MILKEIDVAVAKDAGLAPIVASSVEKAKLALERAHGARVSGDLAHARMLDGLALECAETARELTRAAGAEEKALRAAKAARDASTHVERARALLEEAQARRGRAAGELDKADADAKDAAAQAAEAEKKRIESGGKRKGGAPA